MVHLEAFASARGFGRVGPADGATPILSNEQFLVSSFVEPIIPPDDSLMIGILVSVPRALETIPVRPAIRE